jgi:hypothetical protein
MAFKWLVGCSTKAANGPAFKTKKAAVAWGKENLKGVFIVWKAEVVSPRKGRCTLSLRSLRLV